MESDLLPIGWRPLHVDDQSSHAWISFATFSRVGWEQRCQVSPVDVLLYVDCLTIQDTGEGQHCQGAVNATTVGVTGLVVVTIEYRDGSRRHSLDEMSEGDRTLFWTPVDYKDLPTGGLHTEDICSV